MLGELLDTAPAPAPARAPAAPPGQTGTHEIHLGPSQGGRELFCWERRSKDYCKMKFCPMFLF